MRELIENTETKKDRLGIVTVLIVLLIAAASVFAYLHYHSKGNMLDGEFDKLIRAPIPPSNLSQKDIVLSLRETPSSTSWNHLRTTISGFESMRDEIRMTIQLLLDWKPKDRQSMSDLGLRLDDVFIDSGNTVFINLMHSSDFFNAGGVLAEQQWIDNVLETIRSNYPEVNAVRFLMNDQESETLGGHVDITDAFILPRINATPGMGEDE